MSDAISRIRERLFKQHSPEEFGLIDAPAVSNSAAPITALGMVFKLRDPMRDIYLSVNERPGQSYLVNIWEDDGGEFTAAGPKIISAEDLSVQSKILLEEFLAAQP